MSGVSRAQRQDAVTQVRGAAAAGRISEVDLELRLTAIQNAASTYEIDMLLRDLRPPAGSTYQTYQPTPAPTASVSSEPVVPTRSPLDTRTSPLTGRQDGILPVRRPALGFRMGVGLIAVVAVGLIGTNPFGGSDPDTFYGDDGVEYVEDGGLTVDDEPESVDLFANADYREMLDALESETGSTMVFDASIYADFASFEVPVDEGSTRYHSWDYRDGVLEAESLKGTSDDPRVDLATIRPRLLRRLRDRVTGLVDEPTIWYVSISGHDPEEGVLSVYASNEYGESAYVNATVDGKITRTYQS